MRDLDAVFLILSTASSKPSWMASARSDQVGRCGPALCRRQDLPHRRRAATDMGFNAMCSRAPALQERINATRLAHARSAEVVDVSQRAVTVRNVGEARERIIPACALFVMVGAAPNTHWLSGLVDLDEKGFVLTGAAAGVDSPFATSRPGLFAVGDVRSGSVKRVASSVGEGSVVISKVWEFVNRRRED